MSRAARPAAVATGVVLAVAFLGIAVRILLVPAYTSLLVGAVDSAALADLPQEQTLELAEEVRAYVAGAPGATLPATLPDGRPAFDAKAVSHLDDVRDVLRGALVATVAAALVAGVALGMLAARGRADALALALRAAAWALGGLVAFALLVALADFDRFFAGFHALFFEAGTWQFAADALLIRLFPEPFWAASGAAWGALVLASAGACGLLARAVRRRSSAMGA